MLSLSDERWRELTGGYRVPVDLPDLLRRLEEADEPSEVWPEVWEDLIHQGDLGEGSYAAVPHLVRIERQQDGVDGNVYALVVEIELARDSPRNPALPDWAREDYDSALRELARLGLRELPAASDSETIRSILALVAITFGARTHGRLLARFTDDEVLELEKTALGDP